jgi:RNA polymerase sigma-70 factor (ECF subfamily)
MSNHTLSNPQEWVEQYGDYLYHYAFMKLRDEQQAEDTVQETLLAAIKACEKFSGKSTEKTWLTGILRHKIFDQLRKKYREQAHLQIPEQTDTVAVDFFFDNHDHWEPKPKSWANPRASLEEKEFWRIFAKCIDKLPEKVSQAFNARMVDEIPYEDLCNILHISSTHLGVMLHRARLQMRQCLEQNWFRK